MRKKKAVALPTAIALCSILLITSFAVATAVLDAVFVSRINSYNIDSKLYYEKCSLDFINNDLVIDPTTDKVNWEVVEGDTSNIKALVARSKTSNNIIFYCIYDFDANEYLAYQFEDIYILEKEVDHVTYYYLGGIVKLEVN